MLSTPVAKYSDLQLQDEIDYRARLVIVSPGLSRYRALGKDLQTGPGEIVLVSSFTHTMNVQLNRSRVEKWLCCDSGINKKFFEGEAYKVLQMKIKASC